MCNNESEKDRSICTPAIVRGSSVSFFNLMHTVHQRCPRTVDLPLFKLPCAVRQRRGEMSPWNPDMSVDRFLFFCTSKNQPTMSDRKTFFPVLFSVQPGLELYNIVPAAIGTCRKILGS